MPPAPLIDAVGDFVDAMSDELAVLSGKAASTYRDDVTIEASNIVAGVIAADGRLTADEAEVYLDAIGQRLHPPLLISSVELRSSGMLNGRSAWLRSPSVLFDLLAKADARATTVRSHRYYAAALDLAHMAAAIDLVPSPSEIEAIDAFRMAMLAHLDAAGVPRPGQPPATTTVPARPRRRAADGPPAPGPPTPGDVSPTPIGRRSPAPAPARRLPRPPRSPQRVLRRPPLRHARSRSCSPSSTRWSGWTRSRPRCAGCRACCRCRRCAPSAGCRRSRPATTSCSPATPAPARPPSPGCWRRSTAASASCRRASWWRPTAPTSSPGSSARLR